MTFATRLFAEGLAGCVPGSASRALVDRALVLPLVDAVEERRELGPLLEVGRCRLGTLAVIPCMLVGARVVERASFWIWFMFCGGELRPKPRNPERLRRTHPALPWAFSVQPLSERSEHNGRLRVSSARVCGPHVVACACVYASRRQQVGLYRVASDWGCTFERNGPPRCTERQSRCGCGS